MILYAWKTNMAAREYDDRYKTFRAAVLKRDKKKCQMPGCRRRSKLQVHHIATWAKSQEFRYEVSNGITLCRTCHGSIKNKEHFYASLFREIVAKNG